MLTDKQLFFFQLLKDYYENNNIFPNLKTIKKISKYKSYNSIYKYIKVLEDNNYLKYDYDKKEIIHLKGCIVKNTILQIPYINKDKYFKIDNSILNEKENYYIYKVLNNDLKKEGIIKNDLVIIDRNKTYINNKIILFKENNNYNLYKCVKKDEIIRLKNNQKIINLITTNNIIGKVVLLIRNTI